MNLDKIIRNAKNWEQFNQSLKSVSSKEKGDAFERLTQLYLKIHPVYSSKLKKVWLLREVPTQVSSWLNLRSQDQGIDLIAETKSGKYWAVQCKYREDDSKSLTLRELSTFTTTAYTVCKNIDFGLICTTSGRVTHKLSGATRIGLCTSEVWSELDEEFFKTAHRFLKHQPTKLSPKTPCKHQERAVANSLKYFKNGNNSRGKLIMACGTGKSLIGYWISEALKSKLTVVAVPSLALVKQTLDVWLRETIARKEKSDWICVCSDKTVGRLDKDQALLTTAELGIPCETDPIEIAKWFKGSNGFLRIVFTTYQSGKMLAEAASKAKITFDLGIMDEAHKTVGSKDKMFSHLLFDRNMRIRRRIFMTATERRFRGDSNQIISMDDEKIYGDTFELLSFKEAIEFKPPILCDYRIITINVTHSELNELISNRAFIKPQKGEWREGLTAHDLAAAIALRKAMKKYPIKHAISFHSSIERAKAFRGHQETLNKVMPVLGKMDCFHVSGVFPTSQRTKIMEEFCRSHKALVTNARCLTEGVDVPDIDCILFADPKQSTIDIVQAAGRALRLSKNKRSGYIVIPLLTEDGLSIEEVAESNEFKNVITVLRALASNDDRIVEFFRGIAQKTFSKGIRADRNLLEIISTRINAKNFERAIELKCWDRLAKLAWRPFEEAREFAQGLKIRSYKEWFAFCRGEFSRKGALPSDIPTKPNRTYFYKGWKNWGDWLGTGNISPHSYNYLHFKAARSFARSLNLQSLKEWRNFCKGKFLRKGTIPENIPRKPNRVYEKKGWQGIADWLGIETVPRLRKKRSFISARKFARSLKLKSQADWIYYCRGKNKKLGNLPKDIPVDPYQVYTNKGWKHWGDWLGIDRAPKYREKRPFKQARMFARSLRLKSQTEWYKFCEGKMPWKGKLPKDIPSFSYRVYKKKGWKNWADWLGKG